MSGSSALGTPNHRRGQLPSLAVLASSALTPPPSTPAPQPRRVSCTAGVTTILAGWAHSVWPPLRQRQPESRPTPFNSRNCRSADCIPALGPRPTTCTAGDLAGLVSSATVQL